MLYSNSSSRILIYILKITFDKEHNNAICSIVFHVKSEMIWMPMNRELNKLPHAHAYTMENDKLRYLNVPNERNVHNIQWHE